MCSFFPLAFSFFLPFPVFLYCVPLLCFTYASYLLVSFVFFFPFLFFFNLLCCCCQWVLVSIMKLLEVV